MTERPFSPPGSITDGHMYELFYPPYPAPVLPRPQAGTRAVPPAPDVEMFPIIEPSGLVVGQAARSYCHGGSNLLHPVVHLHIVDRDSRLFVQRRSLSKDLFPGWWDTAVGGHVSYGEGIEEALFREAEEELGFTSFNPVFLGNYVWESYTEREMVCMFATVGNFPLEPHNDEVPEGKYIPMQEIEDNLGKSLFTPNFEEEFRKIRSSLEALL